MSDKDLYNKAICEMKSLAEYVMQDIRKFADEHDYEEAWVVERFREEFNKISREEIESMKNDVYETLKEEKKRHGASKTAEELESYLYGLTCAVDIVEKYVDKENVE